MGKEPHEGEYMNYIEIVVNKEAFIWRLSGLCQVFLMRRDYGRQITSFGSIILSGPLNIRHELMHG